nr:hypothetical protein CDS [Bradyrhizobium sp.]
MRFPKTTNVYEQVGILIPGATLVALLTVSFPERDHSLQTRLCLLAPSEFFSSLATPPANWLRRSVT